jgi:hypothetical protein
VNCDALMCVLLRFLIFVIFAYKFFTFYDCDAPWAWLIKAGSERPRYTIIVVYFVTIYFLSRHVLILILLRRLFSSEGRVAGCSVSQNSEF